MLSVRKRRPRTISRSKRMLQRVIRRKKIRRMKTRRRRLKMNRARLTKRSARRLLNLKILKQKVRHL